MFLRAAEGLVPLLEAHGTIRLEQVGEKIVMTNSSKFESAEQLQEMLAMGVEEGTRTAMEQLDVLLAEAA